MKKQRYDEILEDQISRIHDATRGLTFSKNMAAKIVGNKYKLEDLVARGKITVTKPANKQNGMWRCNASDVLRNAHSKY